MKLFKVSACADGLYNSDYEQSSQCGGGDDDDDVLEFIHLFLGCKYFSDTICCNLHNKKHRNQIV